MKRVLLAAALAAFVTSLASAYEIQIDRTPGKYNLGMSAFVPDDKSATDAVAKDVEGVVKGDLTFSSLFNLISGGPVVRNRVDATAWAKLGPETVLAANVRMRGKEDLEVEAILFDTAAGREVLRFSKRRSILLIRPLGHDVANEIVKYFTGKPGIFNSHIAFVNDQTGRKELFVADYDGKNMKRLTNDNSIVILPRIAPTGDKMIFTSYRSGTPDLYVINPDGSSRRKVSSQSGINVSPSWAPSGREFAVTLSYEGSPNIYLMDLQGKVIRRLTDAAGADTAPSISPDGTQLVFTSDRAGAPHIYLVNMDGTEIRRLTTTGHCDSAAWSPDGQTIVYVKGLASAPFDIYSIEALTGVERRLTWGEGDNENPAWSPDGRFILFTSNRNGHKTELFVMSADGSDQRSLIKMKGQSFTPHWAP